MSRVYTIKLKFPGDPSFTDVTHLVLDQSVEINRQLFNEDRRSVVDTMRFTLKYDSTIAAEYYSSAPWGGIVSLACEAPGWNTCSTPVPQRKEM